MPNVSETFSGSRSVQVIGRGGNQTETTQASTVNVQVLPTQISQLLICFLATCGFALSWSRMTSFDESIVDKTSTSDTPKNGQKSSTQIAQKQVFSRKNLSFFDSVSKLSERPDMTSKLGISVGIGISVTAKLYRLCLRKVNLRLTSDPQWSKRNN